MRTEEEEMVLLGPDAECRQVGCGQVGKLELGKLENKVGGEFEGNVMSHTSFDLPPLLPLVRCGRRPLIGGSRNRQASSSLAPVCAQLAQGNFVFVEVLCPMNVSFMCRVEAAREPFGSCPTAFLVWVTASRQFDSKLTILQVRAPIPCLGEVTSIR